MIKIDKQTLLLLLLMSVLAQDCLAMRPDREDFPTTSSTPLKGSMESKEEKEWQALEAEELNLWKRRTALLIKRAEKGDSKTVETAMSFLVRGLVPTPSIAEIYSLSQRWESIFHLMKCRIPGFKEVVISGVIYNKFENNSLEGIFSLEKRWELLSDVAKEKDTDAKSAYIDSLERGYLGDDSLEKVCPLPVRWKRLNDFAEAGDLCAREAVIRALKTGSLGKDSFKEFLTLRERWNKLQLYAKAKNSKAIKIIIDALQCGHLSPHEPLSIRNMLLLEERLKILETLAKESSEARKIIIKMIQTGTPAAGEIDKVWTISQRWNRLLTLSDSGNEEAKRAIIDILFFGNIMGEQLEEIPPSLSIEKILSLKDRLKMLREYAKEDAYADDKLSLVLRFKKFDEVKIPESLLSPE